MIKIYRYFKSHKITFWALLIISTLVMGFFAAQIELEEDISKLLPESDNTEAVGLAFSKLKVKDKVFIQIQGEGVSTDSLGMACDLFIDQLLQLDSADHDIDSSILYQADAGMLMEPMLFLAYHLPCFVDSTQYAAIDSLLTPATLDAQMARNFDNELNELPGATELNQQDPIGLRSILLGMDADAAKQTAKTLPMTIIGGHLFTSDCLTCIAFLNPNFVSTNSGCGTRMVAKMNAAIDTVQTAFPQVEVLYHGVPINSVNNSQRIKMDLLMTIGLSLLLICLLISLTFRNWSTIPMLLLPVVYGALFALCIICLWKGQMSLMALGLGAIVLGVALSYCLHVLTHYKYISDPEQVIREQQKPVFMGALTTVGAFAGLLFTDSALLQDFGLFALLSIIGTTFACLVFMPQFFRPQNNRKNEKAFRLMERINSYPYDRQNWLLISIVIVIVICVAFSGSVLFDSNLKNINYAEAKVVASQDQWAAKTQNGLKSQYYAVSHTDLDSALIFNREMHKACEGLKQSEQICNYSNITDKVLVDLPTQQDRIEAWTRFFTPERTAIYRQRINNAAIKAGYPDGYFETFIELLENPEWIAESLYEADIIPAALMSNLVEKTGDCYLVFTSIKMPKENLNAVNDILAKHPHTIVVDPFYYTGSMVKIIQDDFNRILAISSLFVFLVLLCSFRNIFISIIAFLPMSVSWYVVLGTMAICGIQFNLINIVISTFIFGIGVDYSIFVMEGLLSQAKANHTGEENTDKTLLYHKSAILLSAIVLIVCMGSLLFAVHPAISSIGFSALVGMISTILITYTIEPFLFNLLIQTKFGQRVIEKTTK